MAGRLVSFANAVLRPFGLRAISADAKWLQGLEDAARTTSGVEVTEETALGEVTIFACVRAISWTIASLPRGVYRRLEPRGKDRERTHPVARVLHRPNPWMNPFRFWSTVMAHAVFRGDGYAHIIRSGGRPVELWPIDPSAVRVCSKGARLYYEVRDGARTREIESRNMLHFTGPSGDGLQGYQSIELAADAVGLALAAQRFAANFFGNGSNLAGVISTETPLSPEAKKAMRKSWKELYAGLQKSHDVAIFEPGTKYQQIGTEPQKSQMNETQLAQALNMCRLIGVPPPIVGILEGSSYATAEQQNLAFAVHTVRPWCESVEDEIDFKMFDEDEQDMFVEHNLNALLRGDFKSRMEAWGSAIQNGVKCADEVRDEEGDNPLPDGKGTDYYHQVNLVAVPGHSKDDEALAGAVQDTALNGAQIGSLLEIVAAVAAGTLPGQSAVNMIQLSFPAVDEAEAQALVKPAVEMAKRKPEQAPAPEPEPDDDAEPPPPPPPDED